MADSFPQVKGLPENWDGYGAEAVSGNVIASTLFIISLLNHPQFHGLPLPEISPETNGTISMCFANLDFGDPPARKTSCSARRP